ncbi:hypothetical protein PQR14_23330 [Paraburkholderia bryophila]|uniref:hypothetical protein n=1 Tax=Burkholderiaceae TaxID=119060 RepID=UPI00055885C9|nr:hypothetical protein [Burkholderia sp. 9120]
MDLQTLQKIFTILGILGWPVGIVSLYIAIKNRRTQQLSYFISRKTHRSSRIVLQYVNTEQLDGRFLVKLVLFNPGSIASVIYSFAVFKPTENPNWLLRLFKPIVLKRIEDAQWWPTQDEDQKEPRCRDDDYQNLYVKDFRVILVSIPGWIGREKYEFEIRTNNDFQVHETYIDGIKGTHQFGYHYEEWYSER